MYAAEWSRVALEWAIYVYSIQWGVAGCPECGHSHWLAAFSFSGGLVLVRHAILWSFDGVQAQ
jgi:hypothetical protein